MVFQIYIIPCHLLGTKPLLTDQILVYLTLPYAYMSLNKISRKYKHFFSHNTPIKILSMIDCHICCLANGLTHWRWMMPICIGKLIIIGSDNGLSLGKATSHYLNQRWLIVNWTNFSEIRNEILTFSFKQLHLKLSSAKMAAILSQPQYVKAAIGKPLPNPTSIFL